MSVIQRHFGSFIIRCFLSFTVFTGVFSVASAQALVVTPDFSQQIAVTPQQETTAANGLIFMPLPVHAATIATSVTIGNDWAAQTKQIWLAGVAVQNDASTPEIGLVWSEEVGGWFGLWKIYLRTGQGAPLEISAQQPSEGATYHTWLSFDAKRGGLSWYIADETGAEVVSGNAQIALIDKPLTAVAGGVTNSSSNTKNGILMRNLSAFARYLPVGVDIELSSVNEQIPVKKFAPDDSVLVSFKVAKVATAGEFELRFTNYATRRMNTVGPLAVKPDQHTFPLSIKGLEPGKTTLEVTYIQAGHQWFTKQYDVSIGQLDAGFSKVRFDSAKGEITTSAQIKADGHIENTPAEVSATISRLIWDQTKRVYQIEEYSSEKLFRANISVGKEPVVLPLSMYLPQTLPPGLWEVKFHFTSGAFIDTREYDTAYIFTNYPSPADNQQKPFTVAVFPDTQYYSFLHQDTFTRQTEWVAANAKDMNIRLALHLGDITDRDSPIEWERADRSLSLLDGVVPYVLAVGNHDLASAEGVRDRTSTLFNNYFPVSRYQHLPYFGGVFAEGRHENSYYLFNLGGEPYLVLSLEFGPRNEVLDWANEVVASHPQHKVIIITHTYTSGHGTRVTPNTSGGSPQASPLGQDPTQSVNDGEQMWNKFVRKYPNILMVLSGHIGMPVMRYQIGRGDHGNRVYEILADFQGEPNGGDGWMVLLEFTNEQTIEVRTYSPYRGEYENVRSSNGYTNRFRINLKDGWIYN